MGLTKLEREIIDSNLKSWMKKEYIVNLFPIYKRRKILEYISKKLSEIMDTGKTKEFISK